jgi:hypothetical protein
MRRLGEMGVWGKSSFDDVEEERDWGAEDGPGYNWKLEGV